MLEGEIQIYPPLFPFQNLVIVMPNLTKRFVLSFVQFTITVHILQPNLLPKIIQESNKIQSIEIKRLL